MQIDFHAVAATLALTVAAARMRFNRLRAEIETRASNPQATTLATSGRMETTTERVLKTTKKKRTIDQQKHSLGATATGDQIAQVGGGPKTKSHAAVPEIRTPANGQTRGKKIDLCAAFNSSSLGVLEPRVLHEDETNGYKGPAAATDYRRWLWMDSDSEYEHPAKRYRSSQAKNAQHLPSFAFPSQSAATSTQDVFIAASSAPDATLPPPLAIVTPATTAKRTNPFSLAPARTESVPTTLRPSPTSTPTSSGTLSSTGAIYGGSDNENSTSAIEHDSHTDISMEDIIDPTTETAPSTEDNSEMYGGDDGKDPALSLRHYLF